MYYYKSYSNATCNSTEAIKASEREWKILVTLKSAFLNLWNQVK